MCHSCLKSCNLHVSRALTGSACCPGSPVLSASTGWAFRHHRECQGQDPGQGGWVSLADYFYSITLCIIRPGGVFILKQVTVGGWAATKLPVFTWKHVMSFVFVEKHRLLEIRTLQKSRVSCQRSSFRLFIDHRPQQESVREMVGLTDAYWGLGKHHYGGVRGTLTGA